MPIKSSLKGALTRVLLLATIQGGLADYDDDNVLEWAVFDNRMGFQQGMISGTPITACSDGHTSNTPHSH